MIHANKQVIAGLQAQLKTAQDRACDNRREAKAHDAYATQHRSNAAEYDEQAAQLRNLLRIADPDNAAAYADPPGRSAEEYSERGAVLAGIREMADFLEARPAVPVSGLDHFQLYTRGATKGLADEMEVDRVAREMGVTACREAPNMHYYAKRGFGPETRSEDRCGRTVVLQAVSCHRTDPNWEAGDPYPDWWPQPDATEVDQAGAPDPSVQAEVDDDELDQALTVQQAQDEYADTIDDGLCGPDQADAYDAAVQTYIADAGLCGAKAVDPGGNIGRCRLPAGHLGTGNPDDARHCDPDFGQWAQPDQGGEAPSADTSTGSATHTRGEAR